MRLSEKQLHELLEALDPGAAARVALTYRDSNSGPPEHLGILDASFNPLTLAHTRMLELAAESFHFDERLLLLAKSNVDKPIFGATLVHRLQMMELMAREAADTSVGATAHGRFIDKAKALKNLFGNDCRLSFILGFDTVIRLFDSKYYDDMPSALEELFNLAEVIYTNRTGHVERERSELLDSPDVVPFVTHLHFIELEMPYCEMSSTEARKRVKNNSAAEEVVPASVLAFSREKCLYMNDE